MWHFSCHQDLQLPFAFQEIADDLSEEEMEMYVNLQPYMNPAPYSAYNVSLASAPHSGAMTWGTAHLERRGSRLTWFFASLMRSGNSA